MSLNFKHRFLNRVFKTTPRHRYVMPGLSSLYTTLISTVKNFVMKQNVPGSVPVTTLSMKTFTSRLLMGMLLMVIVMKGWGQISITSLPYKPAVTNFNSYNPSDATNFAATIPSGWSGSSSATSTYSGQGTGTTGTGGYWGLGSSSDFSLGALRSGTPGNITYSVSFVNNSGATISALNISWFYEQWRFSNTSGWDCSGTGALAGNATLNSKDFTGSASGTNGTVASSTVTPFLLTGLSIANGATFGISWTTTDASGGDNAISIDNFTLSAYSAYTGGGNVGGGGVNWVGSINSYSQPTNCTAGDYRVLNYRRVSTNSGSPTDGRGHWATTVNVQNAGNGGDVTPANMTGGSSNGFLFTSGGACGATGTYATKYNFSGVGLSTLNAVNVFSQVGGGGNDMGLNMNTAGYYTFVMKDVTSVGDGAAFYVGLTTNNPVGIFHSTPSQQTGITQNAAVITATLSSAPSSQEVFYLRYRTTNDFSTGTSQVLGFVSGTTVTFNLGSLSSSTTYFYYILSTTHASYTSLSEVDKSLSVLRFADNSGSNYSFTTLTTYDIVASAGANGTVTPAGTTTVLSGGSQTYTITPNSGYYIADVLVNGASNAGAKNTGSYTFTNVTSNQTISATFAPLINYIYHEATTNNPGCGPNYRNVVTPNSSQSMDLAWKIEYQNQWNLSQIYYTTDGSTPSGSFGVPSGTTQVVNGAYNCGVGGSPSPEVVTGTIPAQPAGTTVKYIISAWNTNGGGELFANSGNCNSCGAISNSSGATVFSYTVNPVITASAGANGSISPSGSVNIAYNGNQTFNFTPNSGFKIGDVLVNSVSVGNPSSYTFNNVTSNQTISVSFVPNINFVYHEATTNNPGCGSDNYRSVLTPNPCQSLKLAWKIEYQFNSNKTTLYYTTDGSDPSGSKGVASGTTIAVDGNYSCVFNFSGNNIDVATATIPAQAPGTVVKYIISAWNTGGGTEVFANSGDCCGALTTSATATPFTYTVSGYPFTYYADADGDGFGDNASPQGSCSATPGAGYVANNTDCNDNNNAINPNTVWYKDADNDNYSDGTILTQCTQPANYKLAAALTATTGDCNDAVASINPGAAEQCNGIDDDCDGNIDDGIVFTTYYTDTDGDGYGVTASATSLCINPGAGYATQGGDCNDVNNAVNPGATEICDGIDNNCDGNTDEGFTDTDGDNIKDCVDPDDDNDTVLDGADNCPLTANTSQANNDGDSEGDACDADDDNDGVLDANDCAPFDNTKWQNGNFYVDADGDAYGTGILQSVCYGANTPTGYATVAGDCNDGNNAVNPGATEICDGIDNDCDGSTDEGFTNTDGDGLADCVDPDDDNDGVLDGDDCAPLDASASALPVVNAITGTFTVCSGSTTALANTTAGGMWSVVNGTGTATVSATGVVTGGSAGTVTVNYAVTNVCGTTSVSQIVTVNSLPVVAVITGPATVYTYTTVTYSNATPGGVWTSSNSAILNINPLTGEAVAGTTTGAVTVSYAVTNINNCTTVQTYAVTVSAQPVIVSTVSGAGPYSASYNTLQDAFAAINAGTHTGTVYVRLVGNTNETATAVLNASGSGSASYSLVNIQPKDGARTISGVISGSALIELNGADNVTFDGLNSGFNILTISNLSTSNSSGTATIRFANDATNNTITRTAVMGSATMSVGVNGGVIFFSTAASGGNGNDNNIIDNCDITSASASVPSKLIYGNGTTTSSNIQNSGNQVINSRLFDYYHATLDNYGIYLNTGNTGWTINNNKFYQPVPSRTFTGGVNSSAIRIENSTQGDAFTITNNIIGYATSAGTGTYNLAGSSNTFQAIRLNLAATNVSNVGGNTITSIAQTSTSTGGTIPGNLAGIYIAAGLVNVTNNNISNLSSGGASSGGVLNGIYNSSGALVNVTGNTVNSLSTTHTFGTISGIVSDVNTGINISKNKIFDLSGTGTSNTINGIRVAFGSGTANLIANNIIGDLRAVNNTNSTAPNSVQGINIVSTASFTLNVYNNTVMIEGTATGTTAFGTAALFTQTGPTLDLRNNILVNNTVPKGTGKAVAYQRNNSTLTTYAGASNNNLLYAGAPGANNVLYAEGTSATYSNTQLSMANYKTYVQAASPARDNVTVTENLATKWESIVGSNALFLHIKTTIATQVESGGAPAPGVTDDFDGQGRNASTPDIGADEINGIALDLTGPVITHTQIASSCLTGSRTLTATIVDAVSGVPTSGAGLPVLYYSINGGSFVASQGTFVSGNTYSFSLGAGSVGGDAIRYQIVAQDNAPLPNGASLPAGVVSFSFNPPAGANSSFFTYNVLYTLTGTYTVGSGGNFSTLPLAIDAYNNGCLAGPVVFSLTDPNYNLGATTLSILQNATASSTNTLTIRPAAGVAATITGTGSPLVDYSGADYVSFNGINSGGSSLVIRNTGGGNTIRFINDATNNTVANSTVEGSSTTGVILISTGTTTGNDNISITNNTVRDLTTAVGVPNFLISSAGTSSSISNGNLSITGNILKNFTQTAVNTGTLSNDNITISNNEIFQEAVRTGGLAGIISNAIGTNNISNNYIHDMNTSNATGSALVGIRVQAAGTLTSVSANRIYQTTINGITGSTWIGIDHGGSSGATQAATIVNNMISLVPTNAAGINQTLIGIRDFGFANNSLNVYHNTVLIGGLATSTNATWAYQRGTSTPTTVNIRNNIFFNNRTGGTGNHFAIGDQTNGGTWTSNYNLFIGKGSTAANFFDLGTSGSGTAVNFAAWKANRTARDANSIASNPDAVYSVANMFTSVNDLHIRTDRNCGIDGTGATIATVTTDIDNDSRNNPPDIGADEFTSVPPVLSSTLTPAAICSGTSFSYTATSTTAGATFSWTRAAVTGISQVAGSGTGNVNETLANTTNSPVVVTYVYTTTAGSCSTVQNVTVTVNPTPVVDALSNLTYCHNATGAAINFNSPTTGGTVTYNWTSTVDVGFGTSGSGIIPSFTASNTGVFAVTANVSVKATVNGCEGPAVNFSITVNTAPAITSTQANISANVSPTTACSAEVNYATPTVTGTPTPTLSYSFSGATTGSGNGTGSGSVFNVGVTTVTITVTNDCGTATQSFNVTVVDNILPVIITNGDKSVNNDAGVCNAVVIVSASATDNCSVGTPTGVRSDALALTAPFPVGTTTITWNVTDINGNAAIPVVQTVVVTDNTIPFITTNGDKSVNNDAGVCNAVVIVSASATDNCGVGTPTGVRSDALVLTAPFPVGTTTITWNVTDINGNAAIAVIQTVVVTDNTKPVITTNGDKSVNNDAGVCNAVVIVSASATDNCSVGMPTGVRSDALALTAPFPVGTTTITWNVTDINGNAAIPVVQTVVVTDNEAPIVTTQNITVQLNAAGIVTITPAQVNNGSTDNCGIDTYSLDITSFDCSDVGTNTVLLTVTDIHGNSATNTAIVTVEDNVDPVALCKNIAVFLTPSGSVTIANNATDNGSNDACGIASFSLSQTTFTAAGVYPVTMTVTDVNGNSSSCTATVTVNKRDVILTYTGDNSEQYSDVQTLTASLRDNLTNAPITGRIVTFVIGTQSVSAVTDANGNAFATLTLTQNPDVAYTVAVSFAGDGTYLSGSDSDPFDILDEDARVDYIGTMAQATASITTTTATVQLQATVLDITAVSPGTDPHAGDIRNARVRFINRDNNTYLTGWLTPALVNPSDLKIGTVTANVLFSIGAADAASFTIGIEVGTPDGYYVRNSADDNTVLTVYKPLGDFVTGGGYIIPTQSSGTYASTSGLKMNFGLNVKFNKRGTNLQGGVNIIFRKDVAGTIRTYQIKSNSMTSLGVSGVSTSRYAEFLSKSNLTDITNPLAPVALGGNLDLRVTMRDRGEPGVNDSIGVTLFSGSGTLLFSSKWVLSSTQRMQLSGGNIVIRSDQFGSGGKADPIMITTLPPVQNGQNGYFNVKVLGNPSINKFIIKLESSNTEDVIMLRVVDAAGRLMEVKQNLRAGQVVELGSNYRLGAYFVEAVQGDQRRNVKLMKVERE
jgi:Putative metal-binding motif